MKVAVVNSLVPFAWGGAEELARHLTRHLIAVGVEAELVRIPFAWEPSERLIEQILLCQGIRLGGVDRVIGLRFPAYFVQHQHKVLWLLHQYRQAYDLWDAGQTNIVATTHGQMVRQAIVRADNTCFANCRDIFTNHQTTRDRLWRYNGVDSQVLMPPLNDPELFCGGESHGYILAAGRVSGLKRQHLLVEAMEHMKGGPHMIIAGPPDAPEDATRLQALVKQLNLTDRVTLRLGFLERQDLARLVNNAAAVAYLPFDEDSVGYVTMEAVHAAKPVITTHDTGGVLDLIVDRRNGRVVAPEPKALAQAMRQIGQEPNVAKQWGLQGRQDWLDRGITWTQTIERLLG